MKTVIFFVRHGDVRNPGDVFYGRSIGFPLSDLGKKQARAAMQYLRDKDIDGVYCSPQLRTYETAEIIKKPHNKSFLQTSELLDEVYSSFDGQPNELLRKINFDIYTNQPAEYEQPHNVLSRGLEFLKGIRKEHRGQTIVTISHGDVIAFLILWAVGIGYTSSNKQRLYGEYMATGSITIFEFKSLDPEERPTVRYVEPLISYTSKIILK